MWMWNDADVLPVVAVLAVVVLVPVPVRHASTHPDAASLGYIHHCLSFKRCIANDPQVWKL